MKYSISLLKKTVLDSIWNQVINSIEIDVSIKNSEEIAPNSKIFSSIEYHKFKSKVADVEAKKLFNNLFPIKYLITCSTLGLVISIMHSNKNIYSKLHYLNPILDIDLIEDHLLNNEFTSLSVDKENYPSIFGLYELNYSIESWKELFEFNRDILTKVYKIYQEEKTYDQFVEELFQ